MHMLRQLVILYFLDDQTPMSLSEATVRFLRARILLVVLSILLVVSDTGSGLEWAPNKYLLSKGMPEEFNKGSFRRFISTESEVKKMAVEN